MTLLAFVGCSDEDKGGTDGGGDGVNTDISGDGGGGDATGDSVIQPDTFPTDLGDGTVGDGTTGDGTTGDGTVGDGAFGDGTDQGDGTSDRDVAPDGDAIEPGEFGAPCTTNEDCESGYCVTGPKGEVCTRTCDTTCPAGYDCKGVEDASGDVVFLCMPRTKENCSVCAANFQCPGGVCLQIDGEGGCAYRCDTEDDCPEGYGCTTSPQAAGTFCQPMTGSCTCNATTDAGLRSCTSGNELGLCTGVETCDPERGWSACSASKPAAELCNGKDDDCDGVWDDNLAGAGADCTNTVEGVGTCHGVQFCLGEGGWLCVGQAPAAESCNGLDDNCDGKTDEAFKNAAGAYFGDDNCGGCGVKCDGTIPNALSASCAASGSIARCEVDECEPGYYKAGPLTCLPFEDFTCVSCLVDDHCSTPGDRCVPLDGGSYCGRDCSAGNGRGTPEGECPDGFVCEDFPSIGAGVRQCVPESGSCSCLPDDDGRERPCTTGAGEETCFGTQTCVAALGWTVCDAPEPSPETCNGYDDNCNAVVDDVEGRFGTCTITNTFGTCQGQYDCRGGSALTCVGNTPATEACNGRDDDCDGQTDEITGPLCPNQKGVCAGSRQLCAGASGFMACSFSSYGGNYEVAETRCDHLDNDCDGVTDEVDIDGDGQRPIACGGTDCDDFNRLSKAGGTELCGDLQDNDCDGTADNADLDNDGYVAVQCGGDDCDDTSDLAAPGRSETCNDNLDNDCDGSVNNKDSDHDTFIDRVCGGTDCNDARADVKPGVNEKCNGIDDNCNGQTDEVDEDRDGHISVACGGDDCDDTRPTVSPNGLEVCGNQVDEDCSGATNDLDADGDGAIATSCAGGTDCDDFDPQTYPGAPELWDGRDNDCDNSFDEAVVPVGAMVISEVMGDPESTSDNFGEWFEVTNVSRSAINMRGWTFDSTNDIGFNVIGDVIVQPGGTAVFCRVMAAADNGGVPCTYEYAGSITFSNSGDTLTMKLGALTIDSVATAVPLSGRAWALNSRAYNAGANDTAGNWCFLPTGVSAYDYDGAGTGVDYGTPGQINPGNCNTPTSATQWPLGLAMILPGDGLAAGGETVTLIGSGFTAAMTATVGGVACNNVALVGGSQFKATCTTTTHASGAVKAAVTIGASTVDTSNNLYTFTVEGDGPFTGATLLAASYTKAAGTYGPVIKGNVTPAAVSGVRAQVGFGPSGSDPATTPNWAWFDAAKTTGGAGDTFQRALAIPSAGTYAFGFRFSADGITWKYTSRLTATVTP